MAEDIAEVVSMWTSIPVVQIASNETSRLLNMEQVLHERIIGQDEAITTISRAVRRARAGLKDPRHPIGNFVFLGPTGVGKTELARALAEFLFDEENAMIRIDMSEYQERHTVSRLIGAPPGYVVYDDYDRREGITLYNCWAHARRNFHDALSSAAKQAEYAVLWERALPRRFAQLMWSALGGPPDGIRGISGARLLLLPGLGVSLWLAVRHDWTKKMFVQVVPLLWFAGHVLAYAWRLPVTYQHGRYLWPVIPVLIVYGLVGWFWLTEQGSNWLHNRGQRDFIWRVSSRLIFGLMLLIFLFRGLQAYVQDVRLINNEMVDVAQWINLNTDEDALIATHDIGAIGYFTERQLLDLAGLISPEVIPFLTEEKMLADYVRKSKADYLVTAPGWPYSALTQTDDATEVYTTGFVGSLNQGVNNMTIYVLKGEVQDN